jgi:hypothetical protein
LIQLEQRLRLTTFLTVYFSSFGRLLSHLGGADSELIEFTDYHLPLPLVLHRGDLAPFGLDDGDFWGLEISEFGSSFARPGLNFLANRFDRDEFKIDRLALRPEVRKALSEIAKEFNKQLARKAPAWDKITRESATFSPGTNGEFRALDVKHSKPQLGLAGNLKKIVYQLFGW